MMNFSTLARTRLSEFPYRWGTTDDVFVVESQRMLADEFPATGFERMRRRDGTDKSYEAWFRAIKDPSQPASMIGLSTRWQHFVEILLSDAYRDSMAHCLGTDLRCDLLELTMWRYGPGHFLDPHTDIAAKRVAHLFYFNEGWNPEWGGCLRILRSRDIDDTICEIAPGLQHSVILERSDGSWHGVNAVSSAAAAERKVLQVSFWKELPRQGKDLPGLETLEIR